MTIDDLEHFNHLLKDKQENLTEFLRTAGSPNPDDNRKVQLLLSEIKDALGRVENETYGECQVCHEGVEMYRLEIQPATQVCLGCISQQEKELLEEELFLASKIHRALLPQTAARIDGFEVAVRSIASRIVGGDYYDFLTSSDSRRSRIVIGDTMGKGLPAGLLMSNIQGALRIMGEEIESPAKLLSRLNQWLCRNVPVTKFISMVCVALDVIAGKTSQITYTNAGHNSPMLLRQGGSVELLEPTGGVIGVHPGFCYEEKTLDFMPGDLLLLYTDGATEAVNENDDMFGEERLEEIARGHAAKPLDLLVTGLLGEIRQFTNKNELEDDITIIALRRIH